jgi:hypothetical protein
MNFLAMLQDMERAFDPLALAQALEAHPAPGPAEA